MGKFIILSFMDLKIFLILLFLEHCCDNHVPNDTTMHIVIEDYLATKDGFISLRVGDRVSGIKLILYFKNMKWDLKHFSLQINDLKIMYIITKISFYL